MSGTGEQAHSGNIEGVIRSVLSMLASKRPAGRKLLHDYAVPAGVGIAAGVVAGAIVVKVVGLTVVMGVATGIIVGVGAAADDAAPARPAAEFARPMTGSSSG